MKSIDKCMSKDKKQKIIWKKDWERIMNRIRYLELNWYNRNLGKKCNHNRKWRNLKYCIVVIANIDMLLIRVWNKN